jgi:hypothetical protein
MDPKEKCPNFIATSQGEKKIHSGGLLGCEKREGRPHLFNLMATTVRACDLSFFPIDQSQQSRKGFLAGAAEELVVRHGRPQSVQNLIKILSLNTRAVQILARGRSG